MSSHIPFEYLKHKLWPKEGPGVKLSIWFSTIKSWESPWFPCFQVACHISLKKLSMRATTLLYNSFQLEVCTKSYELQKSRKSQFWEFWDAELGSSRTKWHLNASPMAKHREYYKGEGGGFPQVWVMVSLVNPCMHVAHSCTKNAPTTH
jgi:hypothetical protein